MTEPRLIHEGKFLRMLMRGTWEYAERARRAAGVVVVALTPEGKLLLVEQYRAPVDSQVIELPAGLVGDTAEYEGESALIAARRELIEETGWDSEEITEIVRGPISPGVTNEIIVLVRASNLVRVGKGGGVEDEAIRVHEVSPDELTTWLEKRVAGGCMVDPKVMLALAALSLEPSGREDGK